MKFWNYRKREAKILGKAVFLAILAWVVVCVSSYARCSVAGARNGKFYGYASWYGPETKNELTASLEKFDPAKLTAAHRKLPFGTYVRVTRLDCEKSIIVRINDRGPYKRQRIIDLTPAGAEELDMIEIGITPVCIEVLGENPPDKS